jgi:hypothetical protein
MRSWRDGSSSVLAGGGSVRGRGRGAGGRDDGAADAAAVATGAVVAAGAGILGAGALQAAVLVLVAEDACCFLVMVLLRLHRAPCAVSATAPPGAVLLVAQKCVTDKFVVRLRPAHETVGIMLADEAYPNVTAPVLHNITIINNVVIHNESGIRFWDGNFKGQSALKNVLIANNTVVDNATTAIKWDAGPHENSIVRNNIFAGQQGKQLLMLQANSLTGVTLDHNLWYLPSVPEPFLWGNDVFNHSDWAAASAQGQGDIVEDPKLAAAWELPAESLALATGSPAIDQGVSIAQVTADYLGVCESAGFLESGR